MHDPAAILDEFEATLRNYSAHLLEVARDSPPGGGPQWAAVVANFGLPAITERGRHAAERGHVLKGALPDEYEQVVAVLAEQARASLAHLVQFGIGQLAAQQPALAERLAALERRIATLAADQRRAYEEALKPKRAAGAGVAGIFANARASKQINPWADLKYDSQRILSCPGCGAPQQTALVFDCRYCGSSLFQATREGQA